MVYISIAIGILIILDVFFLILIKRKLVRQEMEQKIMEISMREEQNLYKRINDIYEDCRIMRHDVKHYLTVLLGLIINEEYEDAKHLIIDVVGNDFRGSYVRYMGSNVINAVLNEKLNRCNENGISMELVVSGEVPKQSELNLAIITANLIDNAIEFEKNETQKQIWVELVQHKGMYSLTVRNHISDSVLKTNPKLSTTKSDKMTHGLGVGSIKKLVKRMDGIYQCYEENKMFTSYISIPIEESNETKGQA
ncbi:MAG: GHKL domain-containing protein [Eubacteriales bacterium]|nr:GHKL domain-containing protein [Eubacteriales bacterium]